tara:strand:+ start:2109 stop:3620 length:1512 start_codon:yes stop_codon:yes gene_type:complete
VINKKNFYLNLSFLILFLSILILFILRASGTFSFISPMHVITGGAEDSGLLAVWLIKNGQHSFDHFKEFSFLGFEKTELHSVFHYNWLLYYLRSFFVIIFQKLFFLNDLWIPTLIRLLTLIFSFLSFITLFSILSEIYKLEKFKLFILSFIIIFGPVTGFWTISAKPDFNYLFFELFAFYLSLKYLDKLNFKILIFIAFILFLSFSTKQTSVVLLLSLFFYLLINQNFKKIFIFLLTFFSLNALSFYILGNEAFENIFLHGGYGIELQFNHFLLVFFDFLSKSLHVFIPFIALSFLRTKKFFNLQNNKSKFLIIVLLFSLIQVIPSFHIGSAVNYYFIFYFSVCIYMFNFFCNKDFNFNQTEKKLIIFFNLIQVCLIVMVLSGIKGNTTPYEYKNVKKFKQCLIDKNVEGKGFLDNLKYYRLPWISNQNDSNPLIVTMVYEIETKEIDIEERPIFKVIKNGKFDYLVIKGSQDDAKIKYDLNKYNFIGNCYANQELSIFINNY